MLRSWSALALLLCAGLTTSLAVLPTPVQAQQPVHEWLPFQLDAQLALQVPAPPRQLRLSTKPSPQRQAYAAQSPQILLILMREELPATKQIGDLDIFYTGLVQTLLKTSSAVGGHQTSFRLDSLEGIAVDFRLAKPQPGQPASGTLWVLRVQQTVYVAQWLSPHPPPATAEETAQKQRFLASWRLTHLPTAPPTAAELARFQVGEFRDLSNSTITRTDTSQTEVNTALGLRIVYGLKWTPEGYELRQRSSTSAYAALLQPKVIQVRITAVQGNTYWYWATIDGFINTGQIQLVK